MMPVNLDADGENDWVKGMRQFPIQARSVEEARERIEEMGWTVTQFKRLPVYQRALERGEPAWVAEL